MNRGALLCLLATVALGQAQSVDIYPEFRRVDPFGGVVPTDRALAPREMLSPLVPRNGHASFHILVNIPAKESYLLYVVTNPLNACRVSLYKEHFVRTGERWVPDKLEELHRLPDYGVIPDPDESIPGQNTRLYFLDIWVPPDADVARFRLEIQLKVGDWTIRPMEVRVSAARIPTLQTLDQAAKPMPLPSVDEGSDAFALTALQDYVSGVPLRSEAAPLTVRGMIRRNALQDMALAATLDPSIGASRAIASRALDLFRANYRSKPPVFGAEWYLRLRDALYAQFPSP